MTHIDELIDYARANLGAIVPESAPSPGEALHFDEFADRLELGGYAVVAGSGQWAMVEDREVWAVLIMEGK